LVDAMTDPALSPHDHSIDHVFPRIAESGTVALEPLRLR
jgi:RNase P/RNase MRP subunit p30